MAFSSSAAWRHLERLPLDDASLLSSAPARENPPAAPPSLSSTRPTLHAYSWHGKKIRVLRGPGVGPATAAPAATAAVTNSQRSPTVLTHNIPNTLNNAQREGKRQAEIKAERKSDDGASGDAEKDNASKTISKAWRESKMARTRDMLGITPDHTTPTRDAESAATPALLPSAEPIMPEDHGDGTKKKRKKKKKSISFSMEANETRMFDRVDEGDVSAVWYSKEEEMANRNAARDDDTPFERIGLTDAGTQTANFGEGSMVGVHGASHGHEYRRRHAEWQDRSKSKGGRRTTTAVGWRRGAKYGKVIMEDALSFSSDFYPGALKEKKRQQRMDRASGRW
jgi:hypothetical protein